MFEELKRYVKWSGVDEAALRALHPVCTPELVRIADLFYKRILEHDGARVALEGGESQVGRLKVTLVAWMDRLLQGPWDEDYFALRCRIGRVHVRIALPQHYMFGAMNVIRQELKLILGRQYEDRPVELGHARDAVDKILDLELAIMLHTYREDLEAQQNRVERLSTFGQLIGAIGHELRNPLGVIESSLYILKGRAGSDERMLKHIGRIGDQVTLANSTIAGLIDMIRDKPLLRDPVQLRTLVDAALGTLTVPPGVVVKIEGMDSLPEVSGDATQLRQLLRNLLDNALHAVGKAGEISIIGRTVAGGGQVEVAISDSGPGVDPAIRKRLFEPLISAKAAGIGLGLSLVKRFVERHGGTIVYAPEGKGARFVVKLPVNGGANA